MNRVGQRRIKDDLKKHQRNSLYKKQINVLINNDVFNKEKRYLISLNFVADQEKSLIDIFLHFFDSIYQIKVSPTNSRIQKPMKYNKTFKFMVKLYFLHDKFLPRVVKPTQQEIVSEMDIVGKNKSIYLDGESTKANLQSFINQQKNYTNNIFDQMLAQAKKTQKQQQQIIKYDIVLKICRQQKRKTIQQIIKIEDEAIKSIYIPKQMQDMQIIYLQRLLDTLISIRFTKKLYRLTNFTNFIEHIYKNYYKTESKSIVNINDNSHAPKKFILKRYTNNDNEVLTNIFELVQLRAKHIKYEQQCFQMSKKLLKQLISHKNMTNNYYPSLSPSSILFNQISLNVQLGYQNPLLNSLGLLQRPTNMENMVCFEATPKFYDSFATNNELINPDLLTNYLIEVINYFKGLQSNDNQDLNKQSLLKNQQIQGNKSEVWRFMMTVYYIMNGQQYYRAKQGKRIQTFCQFRKFVQLQESKLSIPNCMYYLQLFGTKFTNLLPKKQYKSEFYHSIYFFQDFFDQPVDQNDQIRQYGSIKSQQYLKTHYKIIREILIFIENQKAVKVYNTIIYLLRFYLGIFRQFYQIYFLSGYCMKKVELGLKFLEHYINKPPNQLGSQSKNHFQSAFSKLRQYKSRYEKRHQSQITYMLQQYKQQFETISTYYDLMTLIKSQLKLILVQFYQKNTIINDQIRNYQTKQKILILKNRLGQNLHILKKRIKKIINNQFLYNWHHRNINQEAKYSKNILKLYTAAAFQMNIDNFIMIQSILLPILNTGQLSNKKSKNHENDKQDYNQLNDLCEYSLQILLDGSQQMDQLNQFFLQQNENQQSVKQHRFSV